MSRVYVDLHIHSALSPCADNEMTPHNIVNMALLKGLHFISITDHNAIANVLPALKAASEKPLLVVPGVEITSQEEVHLLAFFKTHEALSLFYQEIETALPPRENRPEIFGKQYLFDESDQIIGEDHRLLMNAVQLSFDRLVQLIWQFGGAPVPAHVNRDSFSVYANLGFMPPNLPINVVEVTKPLNETTPLRIREELATYRQIISSDAHSLGNLLEQVFFIDLKERTMDAFFNWIRHSNRVVTL
ncbi:MAG: PHP domain-containing protein [Bacillota bacterium]|nr:PHP domain-containing protein [Bacillota bacterium]MDW7677352.1 PHP domain-containing protein [Bacillota bacterium]